LAGTPTIQLGLYVCFSQGKAGRTAVDDHANRLAVRFAKGSDPKKGAEAAGHGTVLLFVE
jgi:hypothetical protein